MKKKYKKLAIVGNGFDLSHGYKTGYEHFVERVSAPALDIFSSYCGAAKIDTWYYFEDNINILTTKLFQESYSEEHDFNENRRDTEKFKNAVIDIRHLLLEYLQEETQIPMPKISGVAEWLTTETFVFNFNYTKTAEIYTKDIFYVHGSLEEKEIVIGYDYRDEPCLAQYEDVCWSKNICREQLALRRYIDKKYRIGNVADIRQELMKSLETYQNWENSGRGVPEDAHKFIRRYRFIKRFLKKYRRKNGLPNIDYNYIEELVIIGHGIEADCVFLEQIMKVCKNVRAVILFVYDAEPAESIDRKKAFFSKYCVNVRTVLY